MSKIKALLYLNTHFAGLTGEDLENQPPKLYEPEELTGQNKFYEKIGGENVEIIGIITGGDNYVTENEEKAIREILSLIRICCVRKYPAKPDVLFAGPCFKAGRYGSFSEALCDAASKQYDLFTITALHQENPGVEEYNNRNFKEKKHSYVIRAGLNASSSSPVITRMISLAIKLISNKKVSPKKDGYFPRGRRLNTFTQTSGYVRALDMLLKKLNDEKFSTELSMPSIEVVPPAKAILDLSKAKVAIGTTGGIVPIDNPDKIAGSDAKNCGVYYIGDLEKFSSGTHCTVHAGYDPVRANENPNWVLPLDLMRQLEKESVIGSLHNEYFATVGNGTEVANAEAMALEVGRKLKTAGVQAIILTST